MHTVRPLRRQPFPYQREAISYIQHTPNAAVFMEMRLGKSFCVIRALAKERHGRRLIVCPKSVIGTWQDELEMEGITNYAWFTSAELKKYFRNGWNDFSLELPRWIIMNYEAVTRLDDRKLNFFDVVIVDESVRLKDPQTKTTKFFLQHFRKAKRRIVLSGSPAPNNPLEYFPQFQFLKDGWMNCDNYWQFRHRYFASDAMGWNWFPRTTTKDLIRDTLKAEAFVLTRKQAGVANPKVYQTRVVELPMKLRKEYNRMEKEFVATLPDGGELETKYVLPQLSYLQQMAGGHLKKQTMSDFKIDELVYLLKTELKGEQVLIWSWFTWEIERIIERLKKENITCGGIQGSVSLSARQSLQKEFQARTLQVLCMQVSTGKYGLNLSSASTAVYFSNSLKPDDRNQSEYRIEHNSKHEPLLYIDIVAKDTVDEDILKTLHNKKRNASFFLGDVVEAIRKRNKK